jgi:hypothetical protein
MDDHDNMHPERAWDASAQLDCEKMILDQQVPMVYVMSKGFIDLGV